MASDTSIRSVCVFCGSSPGRDPAHMAAAAELGAALARAGIALVYGGGGVGLMGALARAALTAGGEVTGIIPDFLRKPEVMLDAGGTHIVTRDLHERMQLMAARADAFVALPGGIGTVAEIVDVMTWTQLGQHAKPIIIADIEGYWEPLLTLFHHIEAQGFSHGGVLRLVQVAEDVAGVMELLQNGAR